MSSTDEQLAEDALATWVPGAILTRIAAAMNSMTWLVEAPGERYVLKITDRAGAPGLRAAACLGRHGIQAGAPARVRWRSGRVVALLFYVEGTQLVEADAHRIGSTLGMVHRALRDVRPPRTIDRWPWRWLDPSEIREPDLRAAAAGAIDRANALAAIVTHGVLHGDPAPEAFIGRGDGTTGLIDWGASVHGPLLYDVASAAMYAGRDILAGYARTGPLTVDELAHTRSFLAFRWAIQAWYFSGRLARDDRTGIADPSENEKGLADARDRLIGGSVGR